MGRHGHVCACVFSPATWKLNRTSLSPRSSDVETHAGGADTHAHRGIVVQRPGRTYQRAQSARGHPGSHPRVYWRWSFRAVMQRVENLCMHACERGHGGIGMRTSADLHQEQHLRQRMRTSADLHQEQHLRQRMAQYTALTNTMHPHHPRSLPAKAGSHRHSAPTKAGRDHGAHGVHGAHGLQGARGVHRRLAGSNAPIRKNALLPSRTTAMWSPACKPGMPFAE